MSDGTHIEWTDASWNPLRARREPDSQLGWSCVRVSAGCTHCYAATINKRLGTRLDYTVPAMAEVVSYLDEEALLKPLSWRKPRRVFVGSMTDIFGPWVEDAWLDRIFAVMALTPQHTYQLLTKRPERMRAYVSVFGEQSIQDVTPLRAVADEWIDAGVPMAAWDYDGPPVRTKFPLRNVWLGTSVEDQEAADKRIPELLATPAAVRFLSCEPLLGPLELERWLHDSDCVAAGDEDPPLGVCICNEPREDHISWLIVGGESGPGARPCDVGWVRDIVQQCEAAGRGSVRQTARLEADPIMRLEV
jgi:protein gp37